MLYLVRLCLCLIVAFNHYYEIVLQKTWLNNIISSQIAIDCFFIISGFLIYQSIHRNDLISFCRKRFARIVTPYLITVTSMSIFAVLYTGMIDHELITYFIANAIFLNFLAPDVYDVFGNNSITAFNGSLWTLKIEIAFYITAAVIFYRYPNLQNVRTVLLVLTISIMLTMVASILKLPASLERQFPFQFYKFAFGMLLASYISLAQNNKFTIAKTVTLANFGLFSLHISLVLLVVYFITIPSLYPNLLILACSVFALSTASLLKSKKINIDLSFEVYLTHAFIMQCAVLFGYDNPIHIILTVVSTSFILRSVTRKLNRFLL